MLDVITLYSRRIICRFCNECSDLGGLLTVSIGIFLLQTFTSASMILWFDARGECRNIMELCKNFIAAFVF